MHEQAITRWTSSCISFAQKVLRTDETLVASINSSCSVCAGLATLTQGGAPGSTTASEAGADFAAATRSSGRFNPHDAGSASAQGPCAGRPDYDDGKSVVARDCGAASSARSSAYLRISWLSTRSAGRARSLQAVVQDRPATTSGSV